MEKLSEEHTGNMNAAHLLEIGMGCRLCQLITEPCLIVFFNAAISLFFTFFSDGLVVFSAATYHICKKWRFKSWGVNWSWALPPGHGKTIWKQKQKISALMFLHPWLLEMLWLLSFTGWGWAEGSLVGFWVGVCGNTHPLVQALESYFKYWYFLWISFSVSSAFPVCKGGKRPALLHWGVGENLFKVNKN